MPKEFQRRTTTPTSKKLAIGDRVQLSEDGREHYTGIAFDGTCGTVVGFTRKRVGYVRIRLDTTKAPRQFHERDWEKIPSAVQTLVGIERAVVAAETAVEQLRADHNYLSANDTPYAMDDRPHPGCFLCGRPRSEHP